MEQTRRREEKRTERKKERERERERERNSIPETGEWDLAFFRSPADRQTESDARAISCSKPWSVLPSSPSLPFDRLSLVVSSFDETREIFVQIRSRTKKKKKKKLVLRFSSLYACLSRAPTFSNYLLTIQEGEPTQNNVAVVESNVEHAAWSSLFIRKLIPTVSSWRCIKIVHREQALWLSLALANTRTNGKTRPRCRNRRYHVFSERFRGNKSVESVARTRCVLPPCRQALTCEKFGRMPVVWRRLLSLRTCDWRKLRWRCGAPSVFRSECYRGVVVGVRVRYLSLASTEWQRERKRRKKKKREREGGGTNEKKKDFGQRVRRSRNRWTICGTQTRFDELRISARGSKRRGRVVAPDAERAAWNSGDMLAEGHGSVDSIPGVFFSPVAWRSTGGEEHRRARRRRRRRRSRTCAPADTNFAARAIASQSDRKGHYVFIIRASRSVL